MQRRVLLSVTALALVVLAWAVPVAGASRATITFVSPSPAEGAMLTTDSVEFGFTYNRKTKATGTLACALSGPTSSSVACDAPVAAGAKGSRSGKSYSGLANGDYTFTVALTLTDGGTASVTRNFSVDVPAERHVYWANSGTNTIERANLDTGATPITVTGANIPRGVAVDDSYVYWANACANTIERANKDGTGATETIVTGASTPTGVAVDASHVYWANLGADTIQRANLDGTGATQTIVIGAHGTSGVAVDATHVYWANTSANTIDRANKDGTGATQVIVSGATQPDGVAVDASHVYWANFSAGTISRANPDGTGATQVIVTGANGPLGVAVDAE